MKTTIAMIDFHGYKKQVEAKKVYTGFDGATYILTNDGLTYETHLSNVLLITQESEVEGE